jgi:hypothetical protein
MSTREERIGMNEALFRDVNERIEDVAEEFDITSDPLDFICECGDPTCVERITMTHAEYEQVRSDAHLFAVFPGHEEPDVERVVERRKAYDVVQKHAGAPERIAEQTDPRRKT